MRDMEDEIIERLSKEELVDDIDNLFESLTTMEAAVAILISYGFRQVEISRHFEISRQRVNEIIKIIRNKYEKVKNNECRGFE
jgi:DNA-directed RNA polymerase specialized sigma24 family protein